MGVASGEAARARTGHALRGRHPEELRRDDQAARQTGRQARATPGDIRAREELGTQLAKVGRLDEGTGYVSVRLLEHRDVALLDYGEAEAGFTYRQKCVEAWKLAEKQAVF
jgi:hypothetical protein